MLFRIKKVKKLSVNYWKFYFAVVGWNGDSEPVKFFNASKWGYFNNIFNFEKPESLLLMLRMCSIKVVCQQFKIVCWHNAAGIYDLMKKIYRGNNKEVRHPCDRMLGDHTEVARSYDKLYKMTWWRVRDRLAVTWRPMWTRSASRRPRFRNWACVHQVPSSSWGNISISVRKGYIHVNMYPVTD